MRFNPQKMRRARENAGMSQEDVGRLVGIGQSAVTKREGGGNLGIAALQKVADELHVDLSEFFDFDGSEKCFSSFSGEDTDLFYAQNVLNRHTKTVRLLSKIKSDLLSEQPPGHVKTERRRIIINIKNTLGMA